MRIELRDSTRTRLGRITLDPALRPTRVAIACHDQSPREVFLNWDAATDDAGQLRACVACGCRELFREKSFPWVTAIVVLLAFLGSVVGLLGMADTTLKQLGLVVILLVDIALLVFSRSRLVCYRCGTSFRGLAIARYHRPWDRSIADRHRMIAASTGTSQRSPLTDETASSVVAGAADPGGASVTRPSTFRRTLSMFQRFRHGSTSSSSGPSP